jgi:ribosome recycling factor
MPPLTEERRRDLSKVVRNASEDSEGRGRNLRAMPTTMPRSC